MIIKDPIIITAKKMKKVEEKVVETPIEIDTTGLFDDLPGGDNI